MSDGPQDVSKDEILVETLNSVLTCPNLVVNINPEDSEEIGFFTEFNLNEVAEFSDLAKRINQTE